MIGMAISLPLHLLFCFFIALTPAENRININTDAKTVSLSNPLSSAYSMKESNAFVRGPYTVSDYRRARKAFIAKIDSGKIYPPLARENGIEGQVELAITLDREGRLSDFRIVHSSGSAILDEAARALVEGSLPFEHGFPTVFIVRVTIAYKLKD
jgi:TonB family protein